MAATSYDNLGSRILSSTGESNCSVACFSSNKQPHCSEIIGHPVK